MDTSRLAIVIGLTAAGVAVLFLAKTAIVAVLYSGRWFGAICAGFVVLPFVFYYGRDPVALRAGMMEE